MPFHCVKFVQIQSFFWSVFSRIRTVSVFSPNTGKYGPEKTPYLDNFHAVLNDNIIWCKYSRVITDLKKSESFFLLSAPKYLGTRLEILRIFWNVILSKKIGKT